ncbi:MAG: hypothetical protein KDH96_02080 [Candidatus Riesia sp.]|nr:hypothetical protein [Candidatus Riesia sp.]
MALAELYTGTEAVSTTEWSLTTDTAGPDTNTTEGIYQAFIDVSDMIAGDQLRLKIYEKVRSGDTQRLLYQKVLTGIQSEPVFVTPALHLKHGWDYTLYAVAGTITVNWSIRQVA